MEKAIFFSIFSFWIMPIVSSDFSEHETTLLRVQTGESISLNCNLTNRYEMAWYHQYSQKLTQLISAKTSSVAGRKLLVTHNQNWSRLTVNADEGINTVTLVISGVTESDSGLYFCGTKSVTSEMHFNKPIRLQMDDELTDREDKVHSDTDPPEDDEISDGVTLTERLMIFVGVGLAVFVFFLATVITGGAIHYHGWQKGWAAAERSSLIHHKSLK